MKFPRIGVVLCFMTVIAGCAAPLPAEQTPPIAPAKIPSTPGIVGEFMAGAAIVDITSPTFIPVNDRLFAKALAIKNGDIMAVIVTVDAVAIAGIGSFGDDYLSKVRARLQKELGINPAHVLINASHCHGTVCNDVAERTVQAVREAVAKMVPVTVGSGVGHESRVSENRRLRLKSGKEWDVRHAYALPPDDEVASVGPIDPQIGILRLDRKDGRTLAVIYNFACHPIQGVPNGGNTADMTGFASKVIQDNLSDGAVALFVQGCAGDINPVMYKDVNAPRDAEPLGNMLGLSVLKGVKPIKTTATGKLAVINETLQLPRGDLGAKLDAMKVEQMRLLRSLKGTSLNLKTFMPLAAKYGLSPEFPSYSSHRYLHDKTIGRDDWEKLDVANRKNMQDYMGNILIMEELTRVQTNIALLTRHHEAALAAGRKPLEVEVVGLRVHDFVLISFPGELTVQIGLNIKKASPHLRTFVAGYTNGYIYYAPTAEQLKNLGNAQEDSDCKLAPEWQKIFEDQVADILKRI